MWVLVDLNYYTPYRKPKASCYTFKPRDHLKHKNVTPEGFEPSTHWLVPLTGFEPVFDFSTS